MVWFLWAIAASVCAAALAESNRVFKLQARPLNAWRSTFAAFMIGAALPYMKWPDDRAFYIVAVLDGVVTAIGMILFFYMAYRKTGRVSSMMIPLSSVAAYLTWWMMRPMERPDLLENPFQVVLAVSSFTLVCIAFQKVRDNDVSWDSFLAVLPVGLTFGVIDALTKDVLSGTHYHYQFVLAYTFVSIAVCAVAAWVSVIPVPVGGRQTKLLDGSLLWGGFWCGFWTVGMMLASVLSLSAAPNPSLPALVLALTPCWLFLLNYLRRVDDDVSVASSLLILAGAVGLLLSTL